MSFTLQAQGHEERRNQIDVEHYAFRLELNDTSNEIAGRAEASLRFLRPVETFYLDLIGRTSDRQTGMTVSEVFADGQAVTYQQTADRLWITLPSAARTDQTTRFSIQYRGVPADGLVIAQNRHGDRTFFGDNWPDRARHWLPTVDHPSDKATVDFTVVAPEHYQVVANGRQIEETNLANGYKYTQWSESVPLPTKVMVIGVARFAVQLAGEVDGIPVSSWVYPQDRVAGFGDYQLAVGVLDFFTEHLAPYPYEKLANVQSKTRYGGMENAGNIFYFEGSVTGRKDNEALIAHEIAHQWFGDSASEEDWRHIWLSEGFATYFTDLYIEHAQGRTEMVKRLQNERQRAIDFYYRAPAPIVDTTITELDRLLSPNAYQKGGWVLHMLRSELGDELFWKSVRAYYEKFKFGNALTEDFRRVVESASGRDLSAFFRQWLYRPGHPVLEVSWAQLGKKRGKLTVEQIQDGAPFVFPLGIKLNSREGSKTVVVRVDEKKKEVKLRTRGFLTGLELDPETNLLFEGAIKENKK